MITTEFIIIYILTSRQIGRLFIDCILKRIILNENVYISIDISLKSIVHNPRYRVYIPVPLDILQAITWTLYLAKAIKTPIKVHMILITDEIICIENKRHYIWLKLQ